MIHSYFDFSLPDVKIDKKYSGVSSVTIQNKRCSNEKPHRHAGFVHKAGAFCQKEN